MMKKEKSKTAEKSPFMKMLDSAEFMVREAEAGNLASTPATRRMKKGLNWCGDYKE